MKYEVYYTIEVCFKMQTEGNPRVHAEKAICVLVDALRDKAPNAIRTIRTVKLEEIHDEQGNIVWGRGC